MWEIPYRGKLKRCLQRTDSIQELNRDVEGDCGRGRQPRLGSARLDSDKFPPSASFSRNHPQRLDACHETTFSLLHHLWSMSDTCPETLWKQSRPTVSVTHPSRCPVLLDIARVVRPAASAAVSPSPTELTLSLVCCAADREEEEFENRDVQRRQRCR